MNADGSAGADPLVMREFAVAERELTVRAREERVARREASSHAGESASTELHHHNVELLAANGKLVFATLAADELREESQTTQRRQNEFLAMLSHELRNPLAPIRLAVEMLVKRNDAQVPMQLLGIISRQVAHMVRLLDDLLDASRIVQGKITLQRRVVSLQYCMEAAIEACEAMFMAKRQQFELDVPHEPALVNGDPVRLGQVFTNLLHNASKYTQEEGVIKLTVAVQPEWIEIRVRDNGPGISADTLPHIFELFVQDDRTLSRAQGGLGIGLTVAQTMVDLHGGTIEARSDGRGMGTEFVVRIPAADEQHDSVPPARDGNALAATTGRILIIEDQAETAELMAEILEMSGHRVEVAFDGPSGLKLFDLSKPQLVLCDIGLPGMNGFQVAQQMSARRQQPKPMLVALSGYGAPDDVARASEAGFDRHLVKPVDMDTLLTVVEAAMQVKI